MSTSGFVDPYAAAAAAIEAQIADSSIQTAAADGDLARVQTLVASGVSVNTQDDHGYSPLHAACSYGNTEVTAWLLSQGAVTTVVDEEGDTPLAVCEEPECAELLLQAGADLFATNAAGASAYHIAVWECREAMVGWLASKFAEAGVALPEVGDAPLDEDDIAYGVFEGGDGGEEDGEDGAGATGNDMEGKDGEGKEAGGAA